MRILPESLYDDVQSHSENTDISLSFYSTGGTTLKLLLTDVYSCQKVNPDLLYCPPSLSRQVSLVPAIFITSKALYV